MFTLNKTDMKLDPYEYDEDDEDGPEIEHSYYFDQVVIASSVNKVVTFCRDT